MKKEITWQLSNGGEAKVVVELVSGEKTVWADGHRVTVPRETTMEITAHAMGRNVGAWLREIPAKTIGGKTIVAKCGDLGLTAENYARVREAITEIEASAEWQEHLRAEEEALQAEREYEDEYNRIRQAMAE